MTEQETTRLALRRAIRRTGAVRWLGTSSGGFATYAVGSSRDAQTGYRVTVDQDGAFRCTCPAELRPACWHRASVYLVRVQRMAGGLEADGPRVGEVIEDEEERRRRAAARLAAIELELA